MISQAFNICCAGGLQPTVNRFPENRFNGPTRANQFSQTVTQVATQIEPEYRLYWSNPGRSIRREGGLRCEATRKGIVNLAGGGKRAATMGFRRDRHHPTPPHFQAHYPKREIGKMNLHPLADRMLATGIRKPRKTYSAKANIVCRQSRRGLAVPDVTKAGFDYEVS